MLIFGRGRTVAARLCLLLMALNICSKASADEERQDNDNPTGALEWLANSIDDRLHLSGYLNFHVMQHDGAPVLVGKNINNPLIQLREASLFVDFEVSEAVLLSTEFEFSYDFSDKMDSGQVDAANLTTNYAYLDIDLGSRIKGFDDSEQTMNIRIGKILVPFLSYNEHKPNFEQELMSPPFTAMNVVPSITNPLTFGGYGWTDWGVTLNWNVVAPTGGIFDIKATAITGIGASGDVLDGNTVVLNAGPAGMPGARPTVRPRDGLAQNKDDALSDNNSDVATSLKLSYRLADLPVDYGFSLYRGAWDDEGLHELVMYGFHLNYIHSNWSLKSEWVRGGVQQDAGINPVVAPGPAMLNTSTGNYHMSSWYVLGAWIPLRYGQNDRKFVRVIGRYDELQTNDEVFFTPFDRTRWTAGFEWEFYENTRLRYEIQSSRLRDFNVAPAAYVASGGKKIVRMNMVSLIMSF